MTELKPCPFCGSEKITYFLSFTGIYMVKCRDCEALVSFPGKVEKDDCIKAWNRRGDSDDGK